MMAGGMYMDEDGWVGGMNSDNLLVFHTLTDSGPTLLESSIPTDVGRTSDNPMFAACLARVLLENDLLPPSQVRPRDLYYMFYDNQTIFLNLMGRYDTQEQEAALGNLTEYAASIADTDDGSLFLWRPPEPGVEFLRPDRIWPGGVRPAAGGSGRRTHRGRPDTSDDA
ncbi:MAG: hypothetical protein V8R75_10875 [Oscillospiraceae bacterium]